MSEKRPFTTDYGTTKGHCVSRESALIAALTKIIRHKLSHVTIEGPNGKAIARIRRDSFWGIFIIPEGKKPQYIPGSGWESEEEKNRPKSPRFGEAARNVH